jgi:hypothetical protein
MRRDIALAGFVVTADEWDAMDGLARSQLLAVALRRDGAWELPRLAPPPRALTADDAVPEAVDDRDEPYAHYEIVALAA